MSVNKEPWILTSTPCLCWHVSGARKTLYTYNVYVCMTYYINSNHEPDKNVNCKSMDICMRVNAGLQTQDNDGYLNVNHPRGPDGAWISNLSPSRMAIPRCRAAITSPASRRSPSMLCDKGSLTSEHFSIPAKILFPTLTCSSTWPRNTSTAIQSLGQR